MAKTYLGALIVLAALGGAACATARPAATCLRWQCAEGSVQLDSPRAGGLSGRFLPADGSAAVRFVTAALPDAAAEPKATAEARYELEGGASLVVRLTGPEQATLTWDGVTMDGFGALSEQESAALARFARSPLAAAVAAVPLALGCRSEVPPADLAALLFPWQMLFKYGPEDPNARGAAVRALGARSVCHYFETLSPGGPLNLANDSPLPMVFGYFAFDEKGAAESAGDAK